MTTRTVVGGAESECGFVTACEVLSASGLELSLSVNSTTLRPNGTIGLNVTVFNALPVANNISVSDRWLVSFYSTCGRYYFPDGIAFFRGYYTLNNITAGDSLNVWPPIPCPVEWIGNGTTPGIVGVLQNVTCYSFLPVSDKASYSAYYVPVDSSGSQTGPVALGTFLPVRVSLSGITVSATISNYAFDLRPSLGSTAPAVYTAVAGDEWGDLVLLHFSVT